MAQDMLIQHLLKRLRLPAMGHQYRKLAQEAARENKPYEDFLLRLLEMEVTHREENTQKRLIVQARFPYLRTLDQFDFSAMPSVNKAKVLDLAKGEYRSGATRHPVVMDGTGVYNSFGWERESA